MSNKLAILLKKFQEPYIRLAKALDAPIFYHEKPNIATSEVSLLPAKEMWFFDCEALVFDLWSLNAAIEFPRTVYINMCINPSSWKGEFAYEFLHYVFMDPRTRLIAGNKEDAELIGNVWKPVHGIAEDFHIDNIKELLCQTAK
jgi:hypothetical protein